MMRIVATLGLAVLSPFAVAAGEIVELKDNAPVKVSKDAAVRIPVGGIAGSSIKVAVDGKAKATENTVREYVKGKPVIGNAGHEVEVKAAAAGKVKVKVTVKPPQPDAPATETEYEIEFTN